jgi:hypothetical protein
MRAGSAGSGTRSVHVAWVVVLAAGLAGCTDAPREASRAGGLLELAVPSAGRTVERDVPAPQVFQVTEAGLWDGRPSLGGVWVAHPDVRDPERVLIRNAQTGAEVVGALFRRERENPGPRFQISSEAAAALGILAGAPTTIEVVALRLERVEAAPAPRPAEAAPAADATDAAPTEGVEAPRRGLRDLFRRAEPAQPAEAAPAPVPAAAPALQPYDSMAITAVDPEPAAPRRGLRDLFRRQDGAAPAPQDPGIATTALAPVAPVAPVASPPAAAPLAATALLGGDQPAPAAEAPRRGLRDLFRRAEAQPAPALAPDAALIPIPAVAPAPVAAPAPTPVRAPAPAAAVPGGAVDRPWVQVGIFAVEGNAARTLEQMRAAGLPAEVRPGRSGERPFWRVVVGPAADQPGQSELVRRVRAMGFADAYAVAR